jgi:hypothetical protein
MIEYLKIHKIFKVLVVNVDYDYVLNFFKEVASSNALIIAKSSLHEFHNLFQSPRISLNGIQYDVIVHHS